MYSFRGRCFGNERVPKIDMNIIVNITKSSVKWKTTRAQYIVCFQNTYTVLRKKIICQQCKRNCTTIGEHTTMSENVSTKKNISSKYISS